MTTRKNSYPVDLTMTSPVLGSGTAYPPDGLPTGVALVISKSTLGVWTLQTRAASGAAERVVGMGGSLEVTLQQYAKRANLVGYARVTYTRATEPAQPEMILLRPIDSFMDDDWINVHTLLNPLALVRGAPVISEGRNSLVESVTRYVLEAGTPAPHMMPSDLVRPGYVVYKVTTTDGVIWTARALGEPEPTPPPALAAVVGTVEVSFTFDQATARSWCVEFGLTEPTMQAELDELGADMQQYVQRHIAALLETHSVLRNLKFTVSGKTGLDHD